MAGSFTFNPNSPTLEKRCQSHWMLLGFNNDQMGHVRELYTITLNKALEDNWSDYQIHKYGEIIIEASL